MDISISIPLEKRYAIQHLNDIKMLLKDLDVEVKLLYNTAHQRENNYVLRINTNSKTFNENLEKFRELQKAQKAKARVKKTQEGGGFSNTGYATIVTLMNGKKPETIYSGHRACGIHAIYWLSEGFEIYVKYWNKESPPFSGIITYFKVDFSGYIEKTAGYIKAEDIENIEIEIKEPELLRNTEKLMPAIITAIKKSKCYHCMSEHTF